MCLLPKFLHLKKKKKLGLKKEHPQLSGKQLICWIYFPDSWDFSIANEASLMANSKWQDVMKYWIVCHLFG